MEFLIPIGNFITSQYNYVAATLLMAIGLYVVISRPNLIKKLLGLGLFQNAVFLFYISLGKLDHATAPILTGEKGELYSNPLPHVLILTAIVVGVATLAVGLALAVLIREAWGSLEEEDITQKMRRMAEQDVAEHS